MVLIYVYIYKELFMCFNIGVSNKLKYNNSTYFLFKF